MWDWAVVVVVVVVVEEGCRDGTGRIKYQIPHFITPLILSLITFSDPCSRALCCVVEVTVGHIHSLSLSPKKREILPFC